MTAHSLVMVCFGLPGSGKSFMAEKLAHVLKFIHISSDLVRKRKSGNPSYSTNQRDQVYQDMFEELKSVLNKGDSAILDATFSRKKWREEVEQICLKYHVRSVFIRFRADEEVIRERTSVKRPFSDADFEVYKKMVREFEEMEEDHLVIETGKTEWEVNMQEIMKYIGR